MRNPYLQDLKKFSAKDKNTINCVYQAALKASQESFREAYQSGGAIVFDILEGKVKYDINRGVGLFVPSEAMKKLLDNAEAKNTSVLLEKKISRFAAVLAEAYRDYNDPNSKDPYQVWLSTGHRGTKEDFINWILETKEVADDEKG